MIAGKFNSIDDLQRFVLSNLVDDTQVTKVTSRKGNSFEIFGAMLELQNPRARISRSIQRSKPFSPLGELFWYLSGSKEIDQIQYYIPDYHKFSDDGATAYGAYGPRIFSKSNCQWRRIVNDLKKRDRMGTRNAVICILNGEDLETNTKDKPCTSTLQFVKRQDKLSLLVHMRSNDALLGMPHDIFGFTMLQEIAAREIGCELGSYIHSVGSLHIYENPIRDGDTRPKEIAKSYINEGVFDNTQAMPEMPIENPWPNIHKVLEMERRYRNGDYGANCSENLGDYWNDICLLFQAYSNIKYNETNASVELAKICKKFNSDYFRVYLQDRLKK